MCKGVAVKERGGWLSGKRGWKTSGSRPVSVKMQLRFCMTCSCSKKTRREATRKKKKRGKNRKKEIEKTREKKTVEERKKNKNKGTESEKHPSVINIEAQFSLPTFSLSLPSLLSPLFPFLPTYFRFGSFHIARPSQWRAGSYRQ